MNLLDTIIPGRRIARLGRYRRHRCPDCYQPLSWIPEAPGSLEGKVCQSCDEVWTESKWAFARVKRNTVIVHPYVVTQKALTHGNNSLYRKFSMTNR